MADRPLPLGPVLPAWAQQQAPAFHVPQQGGPNPLLAALEAALTGVGASQVQQAQASQALAQLGADELTALLEEYAPEIESWMAPLDGPSRALGSAIAGQNPFVDGRIQGPTVSEALIGRGVNPALALGAEFVVPDPTGARKLTDLAPLMGLLLNVPKGLQRALAQSTHPSLLDDIGLPRPQGHGTSSQFDVPRAGRSGSYGPGHYSAHLDDAAPQLAGDPRPNTYVNNGTGAAPQVRLDASLLANPFVIQNGRFAPAAIRPSEPDLASLREWLEYAAEHNSSARRALNRMDMFDEQVAALGDEARMGFEEFQRLVMDAEDGLQGVLRGKEGAPRVNVTQLAARAYGVDGLVDTGNFGEIVAFDPARSVVNGIESAVERLRRQGLSDEEIAAIEPGIFDVFQEGSPWASAAQAPLPTLDTLQRWPATELGQPAIPTRATLAEVAERGGARDVSDWLRALGVSDELAAEVGAAAEHITYSSDPYWHERLPEALREAYASATDPDTVTGLMGVFDPPGAHSPLITPDARLYRERELTDLKRFDAAGTEEIRQSVAGGDDSWLGRRDLP